MEKLAKGKLKKENLDEIAGFGYNPAKLFDSKHPQYQEGKMTSYDPFRQVTWRITDLFKKPDTINSPLIMIVPGTVRHFAAVDEECKVLGLEFGSNCIKPVVSNNVLAGSFMVYDREREVFSIDPSSVFAFGNDIVVSCLNSNKSFTISLFPFFSKKLASPSKPNRNSKSYLNTAYQVRFLKSLVTSIHISRKLLFAGDSHGVVAVWECPSPASKDLIPDFPLFFFKDHERQVVCIASSFALDLYASASHSQVCLRTCSTRTFLRTVSLESDFSLGWRVFKVLLSNKGYVIIQLRNDDVSGDKIVVYSVNGVLVTMTQLSESVNSVILEPTTEYFVITGGTEGIVREFSIITTRAKAVQDLAWKAKKERSRGLAILAMSFIDGNKILVSMSDGTVKCLECEEFKDNTGL